MSKEQLKEEAKKEFDEKFYDIENYCSRDSFINFINSQIDKAFEECKKEGIKEAKFNLEQKGKEDMFYELIEDKYFN